MKDKMPRDIWVSEDNDHNEPCRIFSGLNYEHPEHAPEHYINAEQLIEELEEMKESLDTIGAFELGSHHKNAAIDAVIKKVRNDER